MAPDNEEPREKSDIRIRLVVGIVLLFVCLFAFIFRIEGCRVFLHSQKIGNHFK